VIIGRVVGNVVASQKQESHHGKKILLIQPLDLEDQPVGDIVVALDAVDAGVGDRVLAVQEGFSAMTSVGHTESPIDAAVIGIVDVVTWEGPPARPEQETAQ
jgi:ethanolamine utilization protein EutN